MRTGELIMNVLVIDIGGTHVKVLATGQDAHRKFDSGPRPNGRKHGAALDKWRA
jgi:polyphosphate glucokinase